VGVGGSGGHDLVGGVGAEMTFGGGGAQSRRAFGADPAYMDPAFIDALHIAIALFQYGVLRTESSVAGLAGRGGGGSGGARDVFISADRPGYEFALSPASKRAASSGGLLVDDDAAPGEAVLRFAAMLRKYVLYLASESRAAFAESKLAKGQEQADAAAVSIHMARAAVEYAVVLRSSTPPPPTEAEREARAQQLETLLVDLVLSLEAGSPALQDLLWGAGRDTGWETSGTIFMPMSLDGTSSTSFLLFASFFVVCSSVLFFFFSSSRRHEFDRAVPPQGERCGRHGGLPLRRAQERRARRPRPRPPRRRRGGEEERSLPPRAPAPHGAIVERA
jgi:hypothetical protein